MQKIHWEMFEEVITKPGADYIDTDLPSRLYQGLRDCVEVCEGDTHTLETVLDDIIKFEDSL